MYFFPVFTVLVDFFVDFVFDFDDDVGKFFILFTVGVDVVIHETAEMVLVHAFENLLLEMDFVFLMGLLMMVFSDEAVTVDAMGNKAAPDEDDSR